MAGKRNAWLACLIALVAVLVIGNLANDSALDVNYGWDVRVNCAAVDAHVDGLDPYYVKNLKGTKLSYPYLPVTLDAFRPLCAGGFLVGHHRGVFLVIAVLCGLVLPGIGRTRSLRDVALRSLYVLGAFVGFEWVLASGNFAILGGGLTAAALALLLRPAKPDDRNDVVRIAGAALLGLVMSFKLVFCPVLAALYFLPLSRRRKLVLMIVAGLGFALPILASIVFYPGLFSSWLLAITGGIPGQHSVQIEETNPSLLLLAQTIVDHVGLVDSKPLVFAIYALAATAFVLAPLGWSLLRAIRNNEGSLPARLDRWLIDHPQAAMRITVLAMYGLYLCSPRLKEYALFELAVYAAVLIVDLPAAALAAVLTIGVAVPTLVSITGITIEGGFVQVAVALMCFWILLLDFRAEPTRLEQHGVRP